MAKQTFTSGQVLTAAQMTSLQQTAMLGGDASAKTSSYTLVAADAGTAISMSNASATTITVNTGLFAAGDIVTIVNLGAGVCTITAGTATVATSGSLALSQNQGGVLRFTSASAAIFFQFATPASGDIEGVTAGTGISGGGTSGTVTITNSMATAIDAKGDLIVGTGADTFSRLAVGTNDYVLTAASGEATGLKWSAPSTGKIAQVIYSTYNTATTVTNSSTGGNSSVGTTWISTNLSCTITPQNASSKLVFYFMLPAKKNTGSADNDVETKLAITTGGDIINDTYSLLTNTNAEVWGVISGIGYYTAGSTSSRTVTLYFRAYQASGGSATAYPTNSIGNMICMEILP